ncbi:ATP-binding cassette domain-containing protein [Methylobacterium oryzae CBMB20]
MPGARPCWRSATSALHYGEGEGVVVALSHVDLTIRPGEFVVALGASGCGKTSLLSCIAGFLPADRGRDPASTSAPVAGPGADRSVVFQKHAPMRSAECRGQRRLRLAHARQQPLRSDRAKAREMLGFVGLADFASRKVYELSGGMQQRVGIAQALASDPHVL